MSQSQKRGCFPRQTLRLHPVYRPGDGTSWSERRGPHQPVSRKGLMMKFSDRL